jgi:squalene-hopene/tetraprenyl-beta-curcumene cyclase
VSDLLLTRTTARDALTRARDRLLGLQSDAGWWQGALETNVTMDAEDLLLREFLGIRSAEQTAGSAAWIRQHQRADGTWATHHGGPGDLSTTVEAYVALRLAGDEPDAPHLARAAAWIRAEGGLRRTRVFTRVWLALFGLWPWRDLPSLPPELIVLPPRAPFNIYAWGSWARQTIVPLAVVSAFRPRHDLGFDLAELGGSGRPSRPRKTFNPLRRYAISACVQWIRTRQEADGSWGGIQPPWVYSLLALHLTGHALDHPAMRRGLDGLDRFTRRGNGTRWIEACQSPVWDTVLAMVALTDAGLPAEHPALRRATSWVEGEQVHTPGDWAVRRPGATPGGWSFEFDNDHYPDTDDTAEAVLALTRTGGSAVAVKRGVSWLISMQSADGGWGAFDADNTSRLIGWLPFCDFGAVTDPPSADVTAHVVEALCVAGLASHTATVRGVDWLLRHQEEDGSWFGRWGVNHVYGTGAALPALAAARTSPGTRVRRIAQALHRGAVWLIEHQNADGGWGEDCRSYDDPAWIGRGTSTASQTAWGMLGLLAAADTSHRGALDRAAAWLAATQTPAGTWDEPEYTGTGFPGDFYINYHLYRLIFPISALARYLVPRHERPGPRHDSPRATGDSPRATGDGPRATSDSPRATGDGQHARRGA